MISTAWFEEAEVRERADVTVPFSNSGADSGYRRLLGQSSRGVWGLESGCNYDV